MISWPDPVRIIMTCVDPNLIRSHIARDLTPLVALNHSDGMGSTYVWSYGDDRLRNMQISSWEMMGGSVNDY